MPVVRISIFARGTAELLLPALQDITADETAHDQIMKKFRRLH
jgi:hypothetical protein